LRAPGKVFAYVEKGGGRCKRPAGFADFLARKSQIPCKGFGPFLQERGLLDEEDGLAVAKDHIVTAVENRTVSTPTEFVFKGGMTHDPLNIRGFAADDAAILCHLRTKDLAQPKPRIEVRWPTERGRDGFGRFWGGRLPGEKITHGHSVAPFG
jgi:hypothetical protein